MAKTAFMPGTLPVLKPLCKLGSRGVVVVFLL